MTPKQRSRARVVQALYQWLVSGDDLAEIEKQFLNQKEGKISKAFFSNLFTNIPKNISLLDEIIKPSLDRRLDELGPTERAVLYLGVYELKFQPEVPYKVVINEAVELTKLYGAENAYKLINSSLDIIAQDLRSVEVSD
ncbi:MAG: transcription antitermination factor NusB [Candidatus Marinimicrobia bacterium]|nr:transcription antitermination factor NusB [Candidatus Neomarinimicrobiota bacterium]